MGSGYENDFVAQHDRTLGGGFFLGIYVQCRGLGEEAGDSGSFGELCGG
jgi:hypothetical protein